MANLIAECELKSMKIWNRTFLDYQTSEHKVEDASVAKPTKRKLKL